jgi:hypothetical protein
MFPNKLYYLASLFSAAAAAAVAHGNKRKHMREKDIFGNCTWAIFSSFPLPYVWHTSSVISFFVSHWIFFYALMPFILG